MTTNRRAVFGAFLLVAAVSGTAACGSHAAADVPTPNARNLEIANELSAIAHYANANGLVGLSPAGLHPATK